MKSLALTLRDELAELLSGAVAIVGVGNPCRGDDALGPLLAERLAGRVDALVVNAEDIPESHLYRVIVARPDAVLFLDAVDLGAAPGAAALLHAQSVSSYLPSTHRMPLSMLMDIVRRESGARVAVLAVQPRHAELGRPPSAEIEMSLACLAETIVELLAPARRPAGGVAGAERAATW
jgi:hydrogenase 3 maturation protease